MDDILLAGNNDKDTLEEIKTKPSEVFEMSDLEEPKHFPGMSIEQDRNKGWTKIHQSLYIEKILKTF